MTDSPWPKPLKPCAYHGVLGEIVQSLEPQTEADPAAVLVHLLVMFGSCIGPTPRFRMGADEHHVNLFAAIVGTTAKGRKGMSRSLAQRVFADIDADWVKRITGGLSSGEGLIWAVRDPITREHPIREKGRVIEYETIIEDSGVEDKRLCIIETELSSTLKVMGRDGNTLSNVIRQAWDGQDLSTLTKMNSARATAPHVSIIGHITAPELRRYLEATEAANGFGNRFLWVLAKRSKELPYGGNAVSLDSLTPRLSAAVDSARRSPELSWGRGAGPLWERVYGPLGAERPGMLGAMTARAEPQVLRLAELYALADGTHIIGVAHLRAALELWRYCLESAAWLFGDRLGDPVADAILSYLRRLYPESVTRTEISQLFSRNKPAFEIDRGLARLLEYKLATVEKDRTSDGRPTERWVSCGDSSGDETNETNEITPPLEDVNSLNSFNSSPGEPSDSGPRPNRERPPHRQLASPTDESSESAIPEKVALSDETPINSKRVPLLSPVAPSGVAPFEESRRPGRDAVWDAADARFRAGWK